MNFHLFSVTITSNNSFIMRLLSQWLVEGFINITWSHKWLLLSCKDELTWAHLKCENYISDRSVWGFFGLFLGSLAWQCADWISKRSKRIWFSTGLCKLWIFCFPRKVWLLVYFSCLGECWVAVFLLLWSSRIFCGWRKPHLTFHQHRAE